MTSSERGLRPPEQSAIEPVNVEYNKPFSIRPPKDFSRFSLKQLYEWVNGTKNLVRIPLIHNDEHGNVTIRGILAADELKPDCTILLPFGKPDYKIELNISSGKTIVTNIPIKFNISFGTIPVNEIDSEIKSGTMGISILAHGKEFTANVYSVPFESGTYFRSIHTDGTKWIDAETGLQGPLYVPSGIDFNDIQFMIKRG